MKYAKIQTQYIQKVLSGKPQTFFVGEYENKVGLADANHIWLMPQDKFLLDFTKILRRDMRPFFNDHESADEAYTTGLIRTHNKGKYVQISGGKTDCYIDEGLLKFFDDPTFRITGPKSLVYVYEDADLVGLVLPCIMPWENNG